MILFLNNYFLIKFLTNQTTTYKNPPHTPDPKRFLELNLRSRLRRLSQKIPEFGLQIPEPNIS